MLWLSGSKGSATRSCGMRADIPQLDRVHSSRAVTEHWQHRSAADAVESKGAAQRALHHSCVSWLDRSIGTGHRSRRPPKLRPRWRCHFIQSNGVRIPRRRKSRDRTQSVHACHAQHAPEHSSSCSWIKRYTCSAPEGVNLRGTHFLNQKESREPIVHNPALAMRVARVPRPHGVCVAA